MREIPQPNYDYDVKKVVKAYEKALKEVQNELNSVFLTDFERAQMLAVEKNISQIIKDVNTFSNDWAKVSITKAAREGVANTIYSMGLTKSVEDALKIAQFNETNRRLVDAAIADTQADLLAMTQNINRQAKLAIRKATAEAMRYQLTRGNNHSKDLSKEITKRITNATDVAIIDRSSRRWKVGHYADMLARTNMMNAHREAGINEALAEGSLYGRISKHGATDRCSYWEGKIVKLSPNAPGDYPYIEDIPRREIFHPNCKHVVTPTRTPDDVREKINQANREELSSTGEMKLSESTTFKKVVENPNFVTNREYNGRGDMTLYGLRQERGFNEKARVVSSDEMDSLVADGWTQSFRGLTDSKLTKQFKTGDHFAGFGIYGNGTYISYGGDEALSKIRKYAGERGSVMRMAINPKAKIIDYNDLYNDYENWLEEIDGKIAKAKGIKKKELEAEKAIHFDMGNRATILGYDGIRVPDENYVVLLNRKAVVVQDKDVARGIMYDFE